MSSSKSGEEASLQFFREVPGLHRRQALSLMAASLALANGSCSGPPPERILPFVRMPEAQAQGGPIFYASAFVRDGHAHGVLVGTVDGRPIKIEGNPLHPSSLGASDVFAQASVLQLWDPDRAAVVGESLGRPRAGAWPVQAPSTWTAFEHAWQGRARRLKASGGEGLHLLTGPITSPTERGLVMRWLAQWPRSRWHVHAPMRDEAALEGLRQAFGRPLRALPQLGSARCVLALGADPFSFSEGAGAVRHAQDWAAARALGRASGRLPRAFAVEASPGLYGARADARLALTPQRIEALLWRVARVWFPQLPPGPPPSEAEADFEARLLPALQEAGPEALVLAGPGLSAEAHALSMALNQRFGALGHCLGLIEPPDAAPEAGNLQELVQALEADAVDTLVVLDCNPAYDAPGVLGVAPALLRAGFSVHAGQYADETASCCQWQLPLSHAYEQWGDARAEDGTATLLQPAMSPLHDSRSSVELLALLTGHQERRGRHLVRQQWRRERPAGFEDLWETSLRRGLVADSAAPPVSVPIARLPVQGPSAEAAGLVALFEPDPAVHDGRYANLGWLQELPRPFSKLTWDNALLLGVATARRRGLASGDLVRVSVQGQELDAPVWVSTRHAEGVVSLPLGYGRRRAGRVGSGVGFDAYQLRPLKAGPVEVSLQALGARHAFAITQRELDPHDRPLARSLRPGEHISDPGLDHASLYERYRYPGHAWAMVIDLDACMGCNACTIACQAENNIPVVGREQVALGREMHWIRVDRYELPGGDADGSGQGTLFQPLPCMHCEKAPCELVCPVGATLHDSEGLNVQVYNRCIGTRFCSNNCPYKVRRFNFLQYSDVRTESLKGQRNPEVTVRSRGVMEKCSYCLQRITRARHHAESTGRPLADGEVVTACQAVCPTRAIHFGDLNVAGSSVRQLRASPRHYALLGELNTRPRTTYLARIAAPNES